MSDPDAWRNAANNAGAVHMPLWIAQGSDPLIKQQNSRGVCFTVVENWINAQATGEDRIAFAELLRQGIPQAYIDQQAQFAVAYKLNSQAMKSSIERYLENRGEIGNAFRQALIETYILRERLFQGPGCVEYRRFSPVPAPANLTDVFASFDTGSAAYYTLSFRIPGAAHIVAFGYRPDWTSSLTPKTFYFLDANLGLFVFGDQAKMQDFFISVVWKSLYAEAYAKAAFTWGKFPVRAYRREISAWEQQTKEAMLQEREQEYAQLEDELNALLAE